MDTKPSPEPAVKPTIEWNDLAELIAQLQVGISVRSYCPVSDIDGNELTRRILQWCKDCEIEVEDNSPSLWNAEYDL